MALERVLDSSDRHAVGSGEPATGSVVPRVLCLTSHSRVLCGTHCFQSTTPHLDRPSGAIEASGRDQVCDQVQSQVSHPHPTSSHRRAS